MVTSHYIMRCSVCDTVIEQCRCYDPNKHVIYDKCNRCRALDGEMAVFPDPAKAPTEPPPKTVSSREPPQEDMDKSGDLKAQVYDLSVRRTAALQTDPALRLAEKLVAVITANTDTADAVDHLIALELAGRATCETIKHARGETWLNACLVDAARRIQAYEIKWPDQDVSKTIYDEKKEEPTKEVGNVLAFPPKPDNPIAKGLKEAQELVKPGVEQQVLVQVQFPKPEKT